METSRTIALDALCRQQTDGAFSNLILDKLLSESRLLQRDKAFASTLFYGVLERRITLDYCIAGYSKAPIKKLDTEVLQILRMGVYQLVYMDGVPDNAAVNESVNLIKKVKKISAKGFVNAVLRNFIRDGKKIKLPNKNKQPIKRMSVEYSCPEPLIRKWEREYGIECTEKLLQESLKVPPMYIRVNTLKTNTDLLLEKLRDANITADTVQGIDNCIKIGGINGVKQLSGYSDGLFYVQDLASQTLCRLIDPKPGEILYDMCAAPGGKSFTLAQYMADNGKICAFDLHKQRADLIAKNAVRLGLQSIKSQQNDAAVFNSALGQADKVLCDVPCSGYGVIRRKPEIKYKDPESFNGLPAIQKSILDTSSKYVKRGGTLVYSTCTLSKAENDEITEAFLSEHNEFKPCIIPKFGDYKHTFLPQDSDCDGFFIAMFSKVGES